MNIKLNSELGGCFEDMAKKAKEVATARSKTVEFDFNGVLCIVTSETNLDYLWTDYVNAHLMEWKQVTGIGKYSSEIKKTLKDRTAKREKEQAEADREYQAKEKKQRDEYEAATQGIEMEVSDKPLWDIYKEKNSDPYGKCCVDYAESWAKLMQVETAKGIHVKDCADKTSHQLGFYGITGFMYGAAVSMLAKCWKHGEELRKWHNKEYKHEGEGVVNPAIFTISSK